MHVKNPKFVRLRWPVDVYPITSILVDPFRDINLVNKSSCKSRTDSNEEYVLSLYRFAQNWNHSEEIALSSIDTCLTVREEISLYSRFFVPRRCPIADIHSETYNYRDYTLVGGHYTSLVTFGKAT